MAFSDLGNGAGYVYLYQNPSSPAPAAVRFNGISGAADPAYPAVNRTNQIVRFVTDWMNNNPGYRVYINANYGGPASPTARGGLAVEITTDLINNIGGVGISQAALQAGGVVFPTAGTTTAAIVNTGTTITVTKGTSPQILIIDGPPVTMLANSSIVASGTWINGDSIRIIIKQSIAPNGNAIIILGSVLGFAQQYLPSSYTAVYNGSAWIVTGSPDIEENSGVLVGQIWSNAATGAIPIQNALNGLSMFSVSGDATLSGAGALTIANNAVTTAKILAAAITPSKLSSNARIGELRYYASFDTGELGSERVYLPHKCTITGVYVVVTKAINGANNGQIDMFKNTVDAITGGSFVVTAGAAKGTIIGVAPNPLSGPNTSLNGTTDFLTITTAKSTAGGACNLTITYLLED